MTSWRPYFKEIVLTVATYVWLLFVATNINITLGQTYLHFALGSLSLLIIGIVIFDKNLEITFQKKEGGGFSAILAGLGGWIVLLITSVIALKFIDPAHSDLGSVLGFMGATTPALATSKIANLITFGIAIAFIETTLWARLYEFFGDLFKIPKTKKVTFGLIVLIVLLAIGFSLFHLTAKGLTNISALAIVFLMMVISLSMIYIFGETRQAIWTHIWANSVASYLMLFATGALQ